MKYHITLKALALFLATVFLLVSAGSVIGIVALITTNLYDRTVEEAYEDSTYWERKQLAVNLTNSYLSNTLGNVSEEYYRQYYGLDWKNAYYAEDQYYYSIFNDQGEMVSSNVPNQLPAAKFYEIELYSVSYRRVLADGETGDPQEAIIADQYYDEATARYITIQYQIDEASGYIVHLYLLPGACVYDASWQIMQALWGWRYNLFWIFSAGLLLTIATIVYLCCAAGRRPGSNEIRPGGLNRLPLDLYTVCVGAGVAFLIWLGLYLTRELLNDMTRLYWHLLPILVALASLIVVSLTVAWAAQLKMKNLYWLKNTLIGRIFKLLFCALRWLKRCASKWFRLVPVIWQWLLTAFMMAFLPLLFLILNTASWHSGWRGFWFFMFLAALAGDVLMVLYGGFCFGKLLKGAMRMSQGDLNAQVSTRHLLGSFRDFGLQLNSLSDAVALAAEKQLRSERMKAELITNVSHDIKTPLTSIINFVDLLQKPHTEAQQQEYLEVLARQSGQMKKLISDLTELSKATTGNIAVNAQKMDAVEAVTQALGEFSDKLDAAGLTPVFRQPEYPVYIMADGHLVWRVLFNLLSNAVKYALPGTRLYVNLTKCEDRVALSLKNVSREELTVNADELMERFVQGDVSRNTEGSGLGLNIARGLMESQQGTLDLLLDGDLFKVTLTFPATEAE